MALSPKEFIMVENISKVTGALSLIGSLAFFYIFFFKPLPSRCPTSSIILALGVVDSIDTVFKFAGNWLADKGPTSFACQIQAVMIQASELISICLVLSLAFLGLLIVRFNITVGQIEKAENMILATCVTIPLFMTFIPYTITNSAFYADNLLWCWISDRYDTSRVYLLYLPAWMTGFFSIFVASILYQEMKTDSRFLLLQRRVSTQSRNNTLITAVERIFAYLIAFVIFWFSCSVYQMNVVMTGTERFGLAVWFALMSPLKSFINFIGFFVPWWRQRQALKRSIRLINASSIPEMSMSTSTLSSPISAVPKESLPISPSSSSQLDESSRNVAIFIPSQTPTLLRGFTAPRISSVTTLSRFVSQNQNRTSAPNNEDEKSLSSASSSNNDEIKSEWIDPNSTSPRLSQFSFEATRKSWFRSSRLQLSRSNSDLQNRQPSIKIIHEENAHVPVDTESPAPELGSAGNINTDYGNDQPEESTNTNSKTIRFSEPVVTQVHNTHVPSRSADANTRPDSYSPSVSSRPSPASTFSAPSSSTSFLSQEDRSSHQSRWSLTSFGSYIPSLGVSSALSRTWRRFSTTNSRRTVTASTLILKISQDV